MRILVTLLGFLPFATPRAPVTQNPTLSTYDYIIIGGGTSGLVVANRLTQDPGTNVLVIEAGPSVQNNPNVTAASGFKDLGNPTLDWAFRTVRQEYGGSELKTINAGKALGGSSAINGMVYARAQNVQVDAWEALGNKGWNWETLFPYFKKSETFQDPHDYSFLTGSGVTFDPAVHGYDGPLKVGWPREEENDGLAQTLNETYQHFDPSIPFNQDLNGGDMRGFSLFPVTVDTAANVREDVARAYYYPFQKRENLHVLLNTQAKRLVWKEAEAVTANGVEVTLEVGKTMVIHAKHEVILAAGALKTPVLLELSGIGNPDILTKYGIHTKVNLPTVGENLQDQVNNAIKYNSKIAHSQKSNFAAYPTISQLFPNTSVDLGTQVHSQIHDYAAKVSAANNHVTRTSDLERFFNIQWDLIFKAEIPAAEILVQGTGDVLNSQYWSLLPFSRGNVHIGSADPSAAPVIDPKYFMLEYDFASQVQVSRFVRRLYNTQPFARQVDGETLPGLSSVPGEGDDKAWEGFIKSSYRSNFHPISTTAMMPREIGGVVDPSLKVYGTTNVRVVDASVIPFQVCGHLQSTVYAVAERAADIIKVENGIAI